MTDDEEQTHSTAPQRGRRRRRRSAVIVAAAFVLATGGAAAVAALGLGGVRGSGSHGQPAAGGVPPATTEVVRQTLVDTRREDGTLGYGPAASAAGRLPGTLTWLPQPGAKITRDTPLYQVDNQPVILMYGTLPAYRALTVGTEGPDVTQFEENLRAAGYTGFTVDDTYTATTAAAVRKWQKAHDLTETGTVELGRVVFTRDAVRVENLDAATGDVTGPGQKVLSYTGTAPAATVTLDLGDQRLTRKGTRVTVTLPDGNTVPGTITQVTIVSTPAEGSQKAQMVLEVVVGLTDSRARAAAAAYGQAGVHVDFTVGERRAVLTVPVAALLALAEGGFGVEVVEGSTSKYVPVTTGLFADGRVEVTGTGLTEGTTVGVPK